MRGALVLVMLACSTAHAQDVPAGSVPAAMELPFADGAPQLDADHSQLFVVVLGAADERRGPLSACRLSARRLAEQRGRQSLHAFIDGAVGHVALPPSVLATLHAAIDAEARVLATRPRVDGSANVRVSISVARLREITGAVRGLPWSG